MGSGVGISFCEDRARVVVLDLRGQKGTVIDSAEIPLTEEKLDSDTPISSKDFSPARLSRLNAAASLRPPDSATRLLALPFRRKEQIARVIRFEAENQIQTHNNAECVLSFRRFFLTNGVGEKAKSEGSVLLAVSGRRQAIGRALEAAAKLGLRPLTVETDLSAVYNLLCYCGAFPAQGNGLVVCASEGWAYLFFSAGGRMNHLRRVRLPSSKAADGAPKWIRILSAGILRSAAALEIPADALRALCLGSAFKAPDAIDLLARETGIAFTRLDLKDHFVFRNGAACAAGWETALGLAIRAAGRDKSGVNLRAEEFAPKGGALLTQGFFGLFLLALLVTALVWRATIIGNIETAESRLAEIEAQQKTLYNAVSPEKKFQPPVFLREMEALAGQNGGATPSGNAAGQSAVVMLRDLQAAYSAVGGRFEIREWRYTDGKCEFVGVVDARDNACSQEFLDRIKARGLLSAQITRTMIDQEGRLRFSVEATFRGKDQ